MKKLIELFNKKYGATYGIIDDSIDNEDVYKVYKMIKSLCSDDNEIMDMLNKIKLPNPRTASESIEKINAEHVSGEGLDDSIKYVDDNLPHYNETLMTEISGEDFSNLMNYRYCNINALVLDETKLYVGKVKTDINNDNSEEFNFEFVYDKENDILIDGINEVYVHNHKSFDGTNFIENENSAVISFFITPMALEVGNGYFKLYEVDKVELDNNCLSDDVSIKNSLTVGSHTGNIGNYSVAEGNYTTASGFASHAEGENTTASGNSSHAEGNNTTASGIYSHAEGNNTIASSYNTHAEGCYTVASGHSSHAEGKNTRTNGAYSHAEGNYTIASSENQHVQGKYNIEDTTNTYAHIVGNGTSSIARSNAHTLDWNGNGWYKGKLSQDGTPTEDKDLTTKKYVDDKTEILPVANKYIIFEDAVPRFMENVAPYGTSGGGSSINGAYIFDNLQNTDMIAHAGKFNLIISFNDGTEDITENIIVDVSEQTSFTEYVNDYCVRLSYNADTNLIMVSVTKGVQTDDRYDQIPCTVTKATFICILYSGLLKSNVIEDIEYKKITNVPYNLYALADRRAEALKNKEYYYLYDNSFVWDMNRINERLDENSGVTQNTSSTTVARRVIKVNQRDSEGIGFGQLVPINNKRTVSIFAKADADVIVKVYNPNTKELMLTMNFDTNNSFEYTKGYIEKYQLNGINNIFIAFTTKDTPSSYEYEDNVHNLIVTDEYTFLKKEEILTKANTKEYTPTGDYNPATKKYVDERTFSREVVTVNNVNDSLTLTTDKNQYATLAVPVEIILPTVTSFTELHLFFSGSEGVTIGTTNVKWESQVTIENNKSYEIIFTYVNESIGWLGKTIVYS